MNHIGSLIILIFGTVFLSSHFGLAWRNYKIRFNNVTYRTHPDYCNLTLNLVNDTDGTKLDMNAVVYKDIHDMVALFHLSFISWRSPKQISINKTINICDFFRRKNENRFAQLLYTQVAIRGNVIAACPLKHGHYYLQNFYIDENKLPPYIPNTKFFLHQSFFVPKKGKLQEICDLQWHGFIDNTMAIQQMHRLGFDVMGMDPNKF